MHLTQANVHMFEKLVRVYLNDRPGELKLGNVTMRWDGSDFRCSPESVEQWNKTSMQNDLYELVDHHPQVANVFRETAALKPLQELFEVEVSDSSYERSSVFSPSQAPPPTPPPHPPVARMKEGDVTPGGETIHEIVGRGENFIIYVTEGQQTGYLYEPQLPAFLKPALEELGRINASINSILPKEFIPQARRHALAALYAAFLKSEGEDVRAPFESTENFIERKVEEQARMRYVGSGVAMAFLLLCLFGVIWLALPPTPPVRLFFYGMLGGLVGATISVLQRGNDLQIEPFTSSLYVRFQGAVRIFLGLLFGGIVILAYKAGFVLSSAQEPAPYSLILVALVAGFSERYVPDLLERYEKKGEKATGKAAGKR